MDCPTVQGSTGCHCFRMGSVIALPGEGRMSYEFALSSQTAECLVPTNGLEASAQCAGDAMGQGSKATLNLCSQSLTLCAYLSFGKLDQRCKLTWAWHYHLSCIMHNRFLGGQRPGVAPGPTTVHGHPHFNAAGWPGRTLRRSTSYCIMIQVEGHWTKMKFHILGSVIPPLLKMKMSAVSSSL